MTLVGHFRMSDTMADLQFQLFLGVAIYSKATILRLVYLRQVVLPLVLNFILSTGSMGVSKFSALYKTVNVTKAVTHPPQSIIKHIAL